MTTNVVTVASVPRVGIVGGGFMAEVHSRAARAAGADIIGVASSSSASARGAAARLAVPAYFDSVDALLESAEVDFVHICTPNETHERFALAALKAGKHVICEKPLATSVAASRQLMEEAAAVGTVAAVPFIYRFHPMVREARARVRAGQLGRTFVIKGEYLQDWLMSNGDDNWRVDTDAGGPSRAFADIGSHLCDLIEFVTGETIRRLNALVSTVHSDRVRTKNIRTEDVVAITVEMSRGAIGTLLISQVSAGRKNRLSFEISGQNESYVFDQEAPEHLWVGRRDGFTAMPREKDLLTAEAARYSTLPAGHPMGYQDAFNAFVADAYRSRDAVMPSGLPTFADGFRATQLTDAVLRSSRTGQWVSTADVVGPAASEAETSTMSVEGAIK